MTRFNHSIFFFFALAFALLCSSVLMLYLAGSWPQWSFGTLIAAASIASVVLPTASALASLRFIRWRQPLLAWLIFDGVAIAIAGLAGASLL